VDVASTMICRLPAAGGRLALPPSRTPTEERAKSFGTAAKPAVQTWPLAITGRD
jgi:hypothetical protein